MNDGVLVVGSINIDVTIHVASRPRAGETAIALSSTRGAGGKGANQAAAAGRAGARTTLVAAVGSDPGGAEQLRHLGLDGVDTATVGVLDHVDTGAAYITVTPDGENAIVVAPGANAHLVPRVAVEALDQAERPAVVAAQTEVPPEVVDAVARWCSDRDVRFVLNDGPVIAVHPDTLALADPLVVNEHEARTLLGSDARADLDRVADDLRRATSARSVVVTAGALGAIVSAPEQSLTVPGVRAEVVVVTTGAGDVFMGTLVAHLAGGSSLVEGTRSAVEAASRSVAWPGARPPHGSSLPVPDLGGR